MQVEKKMLLICDIEVCVRNIKSNQKVASLSTKIGRIATHLTPDINLAGRVFL